MNTQAIQAFTRDDNIIAMTWNQQNNSPVYQYDPNELNSNVKAILAVGYQLDNVKTALQKNSIVVCFSHEHASNDVLSAAFGAPASQGLSVAVKRQCVICKSPTNHRCPECRALPYCSRVCQSMDLPRHQLWCRKPTHGEEQTIYQ